MSATSKLDRLSIANRLEAAAWKYYQDGIAIFYESVGMVTMYREDLTKFLNLAQMIRLGDIAGARLYANRMETAARDTIPTSVWGLLQQPEVPSL
jgi:hypothetical protein